VFVSKKWLLKECETVGGQSEEVVREAEEMSASLKAFVLGAWPVIQADPFLDNWHIDIICEHLEAVTRGDIRRLWISVPPGCMKSLLVSVMWPAWEWAADPSIRGIHATYAQPLSNKSANLHRDICESAWYRERWPGRKIVGRNIERFKNEGKGWRISTSVGGIVTGEHADRIVRDDLVKAQAADGRAAISGVELQRAREFSVRTLATRQADPKRTAHVGIAQRLHYLDPTQAHLDQGGWTHLCLPMEYDPAHEYVFTGDPRAEKGELLWPERFPEEEVKQLREDLGPLGAAAQLDQRPTTLEGAIFTRDSLVDACWTTLPSAENRITVVDATFKDLTTSDFVVMQHWQSMGGRFYLVDQRRGKWTLPATIEVLGKFLEEHRALACYVEDKANGPAIVQMMRASHPSIREWSPGGASKEERAAAVSHLVESGVVHLPADAPWLEALIAELTAFPRGRHDDQVDALVMALLILHAMPTQRTGTVPRKPRKAWGAM